MKYLLILLTSLLLFGNCKNKTEKVENPIPPATIETKVDENAGMPIEEKIDDVQEYYIAAASGLRMRKSASLKGEKMDVIKYGEAVQVNKNDITAISPVSGFQGNMIAVKYGNKEGYVFDGFLTSFPPPSKGQALKQYVRKLKIQGFKATQKEDFEEITATSELTLPTKNFQEAFIIAQRMGWITGKFDLPNPSSPNKIFANHKDIKKTIIGVQVDSEKGIRYNYTIPLPVYDKENQYFTIVFEQVEKDAWNAFETIVTKEYHYQRTTIQKEGDSFKIIYIETGE